MRAPVLLDVRVPASPKRRPRTVFSLILWAFLCLQTTSAVSRAAPTVVMIPGDMSGNAGTLILQGRPGGASIEAVEIHIQYDPSQVSVVNAAASFTPGPKWSTIGYNVTGGQAVWLGYSPDGQTLDGPVVTISLTSLTGLPSVLTMTRETNWVDQDYNAYYPPAESYLVFPWPVPANLAFATQPGGAVATVPFSTQPIVQVTDTYGNLVNGYSGPVSLAIRPGTGATGAVLSGTTVVNAVGGVATFSGLSLDRPGSGYQLTATSGSLNPATSAGFNVSPHPERLAFSVQPAGAIATQPFSTQPVVRVTDAAGNLATSYAGSVSLAIKPGTGTSGAVLSGVATANAVGGIATFSGLKISLPGSSYQLTAVSGSLTPATSAAFDVAVHPERLVFIAQPGGAVATQAFGSQPVVQVTDSVGNPATTYTGTVILTIKSGTGSPGAVLSGVTAVSAVGGIATYSGLSINLPGANYQLTATSSTLAPGTSAGFTVAVHPEKLTYSVQPGGAEATLPFNSQPVVQVTDAAGNLASNYSGPVTIAIKFGTGSSGAGLAGTTTVSSVGGIATFSGLSIDRPGSGYILVATSPGLAQAESFPFTVIAHPERVVFASPPGGAVAGAPFTSQPVVLATDMAGNLATGFNGNITVSIKAGTGRSGAILSGTATVKASNGIATWTNLSIDLGGAGYSLTAASNGLMSGDSPTFNVALVSAVPIYRAGTPPVIDGNISTPDWTGIPALTLGATEQDILPGRWTGPGDYTGLVKWMWDDQNLYFALQTTDDILSFPPGPDTDLWARDGLEIFLGLRNPQDPNRTTYNNPGDYQILLSADRDLSGRLTARWYSPQAPGAIYGNPSTVKAVATGSGYAIEGALPWASLTGSARPSQGQAIGFNLMGKDNDHAYAFEDSAFSLTGLDASNTNPSHWTQAILKGTPPASMSLVGGPMSGNTGSLIVQYTANGQSILAAEVRVKFDPANVSVANDISSFTPGPGWQTYGFNVANGNEAVWVGVISDGQTTDGPIVTIRVTAITGLPSRLTLKKESNWSDYNFISYYLPYDTSIVLPWQSPTALGFAAYPDGASAGTPFITQPVVQVLDAYGYPVAGYNGPVTLAIKPGTGRLGAVLSGTTTVNAVAGVATFTNLSINLAGAGYVLTASGGTLTSADSAPFAVAQTPVKLAFVSQPGGARAGIPFASQPVVRILDAENNVVTSYSGPVTLAIKPGTGAAGAILYGTSTVNAVGGTATFANLSIDLPASGYILTASSGALTPANSTAFAVEQIPTQVHFSVQPGGASPGLAFTQQPVIRALDAAGNVVRLYNGPVTLAIRAGSGRPGAVLSGSTTVYAVAGVAAFSNLSINLAGPDYVLTATSGTLIPEDSAPFTVAIPRAYVNRNNVGAGVAHDGASWATAFLTIQEGIDVVAEGGEVWVAAPVPAPVVYPERITFRSGVGVYGGFGGNERERSHRDWVAAVTVIDGGNAGTVVTVPSSVTQAATLDGFTVTGGNGGLQGGGVDISGNAAIAHCIVTGNNAQAGGGVRVQPGGTAAILYSSLLGNGAAQQGGGTLVGSGASATIANCLIGSNTSGGAGGGINATGSATIVNCTISANTGGGGGGISASPATTIANTIVAFNNSGIQAQGVSPTLQYNDVYQNGSANYAGIIDPTGTAGNISLDPVFAGASTGNYHLHNQSPCIDAANDALTQPGDLDRDNRPRKLGTHVDMGAYEYGAAIWHVKPGGTGNGATWAGAAGSILDTRNVAIAGDEVWVAEGTFLGDPTGDWAGAQALVNAGVGLYGGFTGAETSRSQRDFRIHETILDGNGATIPVVAIAPGTSTATVIDGFTIRGGRGRGVACEGVFNGTIRNCRIVNNLADPVPIGGGNWFYPSGPGFHCLNGAPVLANNTFIGNAVTIEAGSPRVANSLFLNSTLKLGATTNAVVAGNTFSGAGLNLASDGATIVNNIVTGATIGVSVQNGALPTFSHNDVWGNTSNYNGIANPTGTGGNISVDPAFARLQDYHLKTTSPCLGTGDDAAVQAGDVDLDGRPRLNGSHVEIGALEYYTPRVFFVNRNSTVSNPDGTSWLMAFRSVQEGINAASGTDEVWVAASAPAAPAYSQPVLLKAGVSLFGGFAGAETQRSQRNWKTNVTVLTAPGSSVVKVMPGSSMNAYLDGFAIRGGTGTAAADGVRGGGIYCYDSSPTIMHNVITGNSLTSAAGQIGAAIYMGGTECIPLVAYNLITGNSTSPAGSAGTCVANIDAHPVISNNIVTNNTDGVYHGGGSLENNTIVGNGRGVDIAGRSQTDLARSENNIVAFNGAGVTLLNARYRNNDVYGNAGGDYINGTIDPTGTFGNIKADPLFVDRAGGDFHLAQGSPCIDSGDTTIIPSGSLDYDGNPRWQGTAVDMGTFEYPGFIPFTGGDVEAVLKMTGGIWGAAAMSRYNVVTQSPSTNRLDILDAVRIMRKVKGTDVNP